MAELRTTEKIPSTIEKTAIALSISTMVKPSSPRMGRRADIR
jgi:hypothetical protein